MRNRPRGGRARRPKPCAARARQRVSRRSARALSPPQSLGRGFLLAALVREPISQKPRFLKSAARGFFAEPVAKFENGCGMGRAGPHVTPAIRGQPSLKAEPIRPFLGSLTNFATGPAHPRWEMV